MLSFDINKYSQRLIAHIQRLTPNVEVGLILCVTTLIVAIPAVIIYRLYFHPLAEVPGRKIHAITGFLTQWKSHIIGTWLREAAQLHRQYGPIVRIGPNHIAVDGSIGWPQVYGHQPGKAEFSKYPNFIFPGDGMSLIGAQKDDHRREPIDIVTWVNLTTFDIKGDLTFSESFGGLKSGGYHPYLLLKPFILAIGYRHIRESMESAEMSMEKAKARVALGEQPFEGRRDFMTYMLRRGKDGVTAMSETELLVNSSIVIGAASETTATALSGAFFYIGTHPQVYRYLVDEIRGAFTDASDITLKSTAQLQYLHACIEETLRIYPPAAETPPRVCLGATIGGKYFPKGTVVTVYQWATFRNPSNFADPDSFRSERWLPTTHALYDEKYAGDNRAVFKPFSYGARDCIGKNLAYAELRVILSHILFKFDFELKPGQSDWHEKQTSFLVWDKDPLNITLKLRQDEASIS
ncbi:cytochrome P450 [Fusarium oxysporum Fo47]|uniref:cytochrome P450 n=1 Tax=Fusarium oxysporum Fo47 TaxID=660027 RepID=UPI001597D925|nr:cytochrome P450 [Fusarium oxysporum Fo47]QKD59036.1 cytochrome P450 [Fusarium oxysporum Fo47]